MKLQILTGIGLINVNGNAASHLVLIAHAEDNEETKLFIPLVHDKTLSDDVWTINPPLIVDGMSVHKAVVEAADSIFILVHGDSAEVRTLGKPITKIQNTMEMLGIEGNHRGIFYALLNPLKFQTSD